LLAELRAAAARSRCITEELECLREALERGIINADEALMHVIANGLASWLSPRIADMVSRAERAADRARWEARTMGAQLVEIEALIVKENGRSVQVQAGGEPVWLNKQDLEIERDPERTNQVRIRLPAKLATQKGLA
jgi:hypothetical protein